MKVKSSKTGVAQINRMALISDTALRTCRSLSLLYRLETELKANPNYSPSVCIFKRIAADTSK